MLGSCCGEIPRPLSLTTTVAQSSRELVRRQVFFPAARFNCRQSRADLDTHYAPALLQLLQHVSHITSKPATKGAREEPQSSTLTAVVQAVKINSLCHRGS